MDRGGHLNPRGRATPEPSAATARRPARILLTGRPGSGKTTVILRTLERLDRPAAGFYTREVREKGPASARIGFDLVTLEGRRVPLARAGFPAPRVAKYGVDVRALDDVALPALEAGLAAPDTLLVVDELGKMEFLSRAFVALLPKVFSAPNPVLGAIMARPHPVADRYRDAPDVELVVVTSANRERLPDALAKRLALDGELKRGRRLESSGTMED